MEKSELKLASPVIADGVTYDTLHVRRPKARDLLAVSREATDPEVREVILFSWLSGVSRAVIEELDLYDYRALQELYADFTEAPPKDKGAPVAA